MSTYAFKILKSVLDGEITPEIGEEILIDFFQNYWMPSENIKSEIKPTKKEFQFNRRIYLQELYGNRCVFCDTEMEIYECEATKEMNYNLMTFEHILPKSKGGPNHIDNICLSCGYCNNNKMSYLIPPIIYFNLKNKTNNICSEGNYSITDLLNKYNNK